MYIYIAAKLKKNHSEGNESRRRHTHNCTTAQPHSLDSRIGLCVQMCMCREMYADTDRFTHTLSILRWPLPIAVITPLIDPECIDIYRLSIATAAPTRQSSTKENIR